VTDKGFALAVVTGIGLLLIVTSGPLGGLIAKWQQAYWAKHYGPQSALPQAPEPSWRLQRGAWVWAYRLPGLALLALAAYLYFQTA